ncbi:MAG TPA: N-acetyltransferase [Ktedonobacterales bacterium]
MTTAREAPITVRTASDADRAAARAFIPPSTPRGRASLTLLGAGLGLLWVAVEDAGPSEKLVGLLLATAQIAPESEEPVGYIHELLVHPAYRRRGVAMHLLDAAERYFLRDHAFALVMLVTSPENDAALRLYRSRGYSVDSARLSKRREEEAPAPDTPAS